MSLFEKNQPNTIFAENLGPMLKKISFEAHIGPCNSISPPPLFNVEVTNDGNRDCIR